MTRHLIKITVSQPLNIARRKRSECNEGMWDVSLTVAVAGKAAAKSMWRKKEEETHTQRAASVLFMCF